MSLGTSLLVPILATLGTSPKLGPADVVGKLGISGTTKRVSYNVSCVYVRKYIRTLVVSSSRSSLSRISYLEVVLTQKKKQKKNKKGRQNVSLKTSRAEFESSNSVLRSTVV